MSSKRENRESRRAGYTLLELAIGLGIGAFVLAALSTYAFFVMNFFRTVNAETLMPVAAREIRDHLYFSLDDKNGLPVGRGLLAYTREQVEAFRLSGSDKGTDDDTLRAQPKTLRRVHLPIEAEFTTGWQGLSTNVQRVAVLQTLKFRAEGVMHGGVTNRVEFPYYITPFGAATEPAVVNSFDNSGTLVNQVPGRGATL